MATPRLSLYLTCLFLGSLAQMKPSTYVHQKSGVHSANAGDNVTLLCSHEGNAVMIYWYKQTVGHRPRIVSTFNKRQRNIMFHNEFRNDRFSLNAGDRENDLTIKDLRISDSGTYYCLGSYAYDFEFTEGVTISVRGSGSTVPAVVHQPASGSIQPRGSVTLNCTVQTGTCDGRHSVYWFRDSGEAHPGIIYTHGDRNDQCERKPDTQTHTCVYNLPLRNLSGSDAGTYYCAVASCGRILFGGKSELESGSDGGHDLYLVYVLSGALAFTSILAVLLALAMCALHKSSGRPHVPELQASSSPNTEDSDDLHYAALKKHTTNRPPTQRETTHSDCVYSSVRQ